MNSSSIISAPFAAARMALVLLLVTSCVGDLDPVDVSGPGPAAGEVATLLIEPPAAMLTAAGEEVQFRVLPQDRDGEPVDFSPVAVSWSSSDTAILEVDDTGRVTARTGGTVTLVAMLDGVRGEARVAVLIGISPNTTQCIECHQAEYDAQHGSPWPTNCGSCHRTSTWQGPSIDHSAVANGFNLVGAHATLACDKCHLPDGTPLFPSVRQDECIACHQADYNGEHAGSGFPTTCLSCHNTTSFVGAVIDHPVVANGFNLVGAHATLACDKCHLPDGTPLFPGVRQDECIACHQADYNGEHAGSGFPTTCLSCHNTTSFVRGPFDHDASFFPIFSGKHQGEWPDCATCHIDSADLSQFTCFNCHEHNRTDMDDEHKGEGGYVYNSQACYSCHPRGQE